MELSVNFFFIAHFFILNFFSICIKIVTIISVRDLNSSYKEDQLIPLSCKFHTKFTLCWLYSVVLTNPIRLYSSCLSLQSYQKHKNSLLFHTLFT